MTDNDSGQLDYIEREEPESSNSGTGLALPEQGLPDKLYLLPISNRPFFPAQVMPVVMDEAPWGETIDLVSSTPHHALSLFFVDGPLAANGEIDFERFPEIGCAVKIQHAIKENGKIQFIAQGLTRVRITQWLSRKPPYRVEVEYPKSPHDERDEVRAYAMALINAIKELLPLNPLYSEELKNYLNRFSPNQPSPLSDFAATLTSVKGSELQDILDTVPVLRRMEKVLVLLKKEIDVARLQGEISAEVNRTISGSQRRFFLKEQLKVIQKELGLSKDDRTADIEYFRERLKNKILREATSTKIEEELNKLSVLETGSPEYAVTRNYLDWVTSIPWGITHNDNLDIAHARKILDRDHDGLQDVKERILEFIGLGAFKGSVSGSIVLLVGPPGVGKTSIGHSIAESLGRPFYRFSVGGMRDEAEIKGHRRTYIGAMPGKLVQALKEVGVMNPVIMLDEIDKLGSSHQGDPASALLETLDPEQNNQFLDHYLDLRLDLSKTLFVCTANVLDSIPGPLLDRMDVIRLSGYISEEKLAIAKHHLWPRQLERAGVLKGQLRITDKALRTLIDGYAREAGVRNLDKQLAKVIRKSVMRLLDDRSQKISIKPTDLTDLLGSAPFRKEKTLQGVGIMTGLAWTSLGGVTLPVEVTRVHSLSRGYKLTGKLGEVMRESAEIAYSYICANLKSYRADPEFFDTSFIHLHVPEGATPKDGPSAGITLASALLSLARNTAPRKGLAMTGEMTLTGQVLPVGGIREKVIAARRQSIHELILPKENEGEYEELPDYLKEGMHIYFASHFRDVARVLFD
jgi:ATP-dependent Lon protease